MSKFLFKTSATMKEYNNKKWWIDSGIINEITVSAETVEQAIKEYQKIVNDKYYIAISDNAIKNKNNMYVDTTDGAIQTGYVITAKCNFEDIDNYKTIQQYIDLWINISIVYNPFTYKV